MQLPFVTAGRFANWKLPRKHVLFQLFGTGIIVGLALVALVMLQGQRSVLEREKVKLEQELAQTKTELATVTSEDQYVKNKTLADEIVNIQKTFSQAVDRYEDLVKLREQTRDTGELDSLFAEALSLLSRRNYATAAATLASLNQGIAEALAKVASTFTIPANVPQSNTAPGAGYSRQSVALDIGTYLVSLVAADLGSTRVIVDTASESTCANDCPVLSLADYVARNGAFAGVNGSYFCPADYPSCSDKKNSFDTLLMNKNKVYFNSDNNVYSTVPAAIFGGGWIRFVGRSLDWGRDTGIDSMIANQPFLVSGGNVVFGGDDDPKKGSKGNRSFVANKGNTVYIGVVHSATVAESARVLAGLGMENALNLDDGGSTALWSGGYKVGPGRSLPNVILFVGK